MNKKLWIIPILSLLLTGTVIAGLEISKSLPDKTITSGRKTALQDYKIKKFNEDKNETTNFLTLSKEEQDKVKEIKAEISDCIPIDDDYCKYSVVLKDVVQHYDIVMDMYHHECKDNKYNETTGECIEWIKTEKTEEELSAEAQDYAESEINRFADSLIAKQNIREKPNKSIGGYLIFK